MPSLYEMEQKEIRDGLSFLKEKTDAYHAGTINLMDYKSVSGRRGTFGQKDHHKNMVRLRMTGGIITPERLRFIVDTAKKYGVDHMHFATCQSFQMHDLDTDGAMGILQDAFKDGIVCFGTGGNFPRNIMCSPRAGTDPAEAFDVTPYALAAGDYLIHRCQNAEMPKKLKCAFCGSKDNITHATYRDLGLIARENGTFDVYCAGGLGPNPRVGVKVLENLAKEDILYAVQTMVSVFQKYGCSKDASKRRTRYMVEALGGDDGFRKAWLDEYAIISQDPSLKLEPLKEERITKTGDGSLAKEDWRIAKQKQDGLYSVLWHPAGGKPSLAMLEALSKEIEGMEQIELRTSPFQNVYVTNLTGSEANRILDLLEDDNAKTLFETSVACVGASTCQVGLQDSQKLLNACIEKTREANLPFDALPQIHFSGCHNSCGAHQTAEIGFSGSFARKDGRPVRSFDLCLYGSNDQDHSVMGRTIGSMAIETIPDFIAGLGKHVADSGMSYAEWKEKNPQGTEEFAKPYLI